MPRYNLSLQYIYNCLQDADHDAGTGETQTVGFGLRTIQELFAWRIYRLSKKLFISAIFWTLTLLRLGSGLALSAKSFLDVPKDPNVLFLMKDYGWLITLAATIGAVIDVLVAASPCFYLKQLSLKIQSKKQISCSKVAHSVL